MKVLRVTVGSASRRLGSLGPFGCVGAMGAPPTGTADALMPEGGMGGFCILRDCKATVSTEHAESKVRGTTPKGSIRDASKADGDEAGEQGSRTRRRHCWAVRGLLRMRVGGGAVANSHGAGEAGTPGRTGQGRQQHTSASSSRAKQ